MKLFTKCSVGVLVLAGVSFAYSAPRGQGTPNQADTELKDLMVQRRDVAKDVVFACRELVYGQEYSSIESFRALRDARKDLLEAELALAKTEAERFALLEEGVEQADKFLMILNQRHVSGVAILQAKADRITAQIALHKAKM